MSTPSIATQTLPAHHSQYSYTHQNPYSASAHAYPTQTTLPAPPRLATTYQNYSNLTQYSRPPMSPASYKQPSHASSIAPSHSASDMASKRRHPDWNEFYKNGVPKEIIVIDDDDSPGPQDAGRPSNRQVRQDQGSFSSQTGRKRKIDRGYEVEYNDSPTFSSHPAKFGASSSSASYQSGDRTASLQTTTAPTSLESYGSTAASNSYEDVARAGQKRKRVQPERTQSRKRKQDSVPDAFADYVPPAKPVKKSAEVPVPVIRDTIHKSQKVDDDDGHYIVHPNSVMTERCKLIFHATRSMH